MQIRNFLLIFEDLTVLDTRSDFSTVNPGFLPRMCLL